MTLTIQLIVNPHAGHGHGPRIAAHLARALSRSGLGVRALVLERPGEVARWAASCAGGFEYLVGVGGDGTHSDLASAAVRCSTPLVAVPAGFANLFAAAIGHTSRVGAIVRLLRAGVPERVDLGLSPQGPFLACVSFGVVEDATTGVLSGSRGLAVRPLRYLAYLRAAAGRLAAAPLPSIAVEVDGATVATDAAAVVVANAPTAGWFVDVAPNARLVDGELDVVVLTAPAKLGVFAQLLGLFLEHRGDGRGIVRRLGTRVTVSSARQRMQLSVVPGALPILTLPWAFALVGTALAHPHRRVGEPASIAKGSIYESMECQ